MSELKCPLCKQNVSRELFEKITGIWKERKKQEKELKEEKSKILAQQRENKRRFEAERKQLKASQKKIIDRKIGEYGKKFERKINALENQKKRIQEQTEKKILKAVKATERQAKLHAKKHIKEELDKSVKKALARSETKSAKDLRKAHQSIKSFELQMKTVNKLNTKQSQDIKYLQEQLKKRTTPQAEGLLYEEELLKALEAEFSKDKFQHTGKGGDILHEICIDNVCVGLMVYECKKVRGWQGAHAEQAYRAKIDRKAEFAILVTNAIKKGTGGFFIEKGVIVVDPAGVITLALILRDQVSRMAELKLTQEEKNRAIKQTMDYLQGADFKNTLDVVIRKSIEMHEDLKKEFRDHIKMWKKRQDDLKQVYLNSSKVQRRTLALIAGKDDNGDAPKEIESIPALEELKE